MHVDEDSRPSPALANSSFPFFAPRLSAWLWEQKSHGDIEGVLLNLKTAFYIPFSRLAASCCFILRVHAGFIDEDGSHCEQAVCFSLESLVGCITKASTWAGW